MADRTQAYKALNIPTGNKLLLTLDGGGIRGILTIQLLKKLEEVSGLPCWQLFDMVAGTSTGGIIAGLIATQHTAAQIEQLYQELVTKVLTSAGPFANRYLNPPAYTKANYRETLKTLLADRTVQQACDGSQVDLMITAHDVCEGEETFFSYFQGQDATYKTVLLRAVMEATMSAPTYFMPLERFVDGGATTHNTPVVAAITEATKYGPQGKYDAAHLTVFSFGTGCGRRFESPEQVMHPDGVDAYFWLNWLLDEVGDDAADMQCALLRSGMIHGLDFRRFQISLDAEAMHKLPNREIAHIHSVQANWLWDLVDADLAGIALDKVEFFPLMQSIGEAMVERFLNPDGKPFPDPVFSRDCVDPLTGKELLVTRRGDTTRIRTQMSDSAWLAKVPVK